jgi:hypothetical protein
MSELYLVVYDYGMGGLWALVAAESADSIIAKFPELAVVSERPDWLDDKQYQRLERLDLDSPKPEGLLEVIVAERRQ